MREVVEVDSKGRIVIPNSIRSKFGFKEGTQLVIEIRSDEIVVRKIPEETVDHIKPDNLKDFLPR